jgi:hypothetical protein
VAVITKEERQEVAARLRNVRITCRKNKDEILLWYTSLCQAVGGKKDPWYGIYALCNRLADLIDPTCEDISKPPKDGFYPVPVFECSKCKCKHISPDYVRFCPSCGARVVNVNEKS